MYIYIYIYIPSVRARRARNLARHDATLCGIASNRHAQRIGVLLRTRMLHAANRVVSARLATKHATWRGSRKSCERERHEKKRRAARDLRACGSSTARDRGRGSIASQPSSASRKHMYCPNPAAASGAPTHICVFYERPQKGKQYQSLEHQAN